MVLQQLSQLSSSHLLKRMRRPLQFSQALSPHFLNRGLPHQLSKEAKVDSKARKNHLERSSELTRDPHNLQGPFNPREVTSLIAHKLLKLRVEIELIKILILLRDSNRVPRLDAMTHLKVLKRNSKVWRNLKMPLSARRDTNSFR